jgi:hypothetical protein
MPVATVAARRPAACSQVGTPVLHAGDFVDYWTGVGVTVTGLRRGTYGLWASSYDGVGQGYAVGPNVTVGPNGRATLWFDQVAANHEEWTAYVYTVPGTPSQTTIVTCDVDV